MEFVENKDKSAVNSIPSRMLVNKYCITASLALYNIFQRNYNSEANVISSCVFCVIM